MASANYTRDEGKLMKIAVLSGDGIGPEVTAQALKVLDVFAQEGTPFEFEHGLIGGCAYDVSGHPLPDSTFKLAREADAILFGAEGGFQYETLPRGLRPGDALLTIRRELNLFANFRPVVTWPELVGASPLKAERLEGLDLLILRELTGDLYFGEPRGVTSENGIRVGINTMRYDETEVRRIAHVAFKTARTRRGKVCSVDKANVLESMELWREVVEEVAREYPDVALEHLYVDAAAMSLLRSPQNFDVVLTGNLFGDILSDEASMLTGSIGMLPSASMGEGTKGLYEPVHGCAPDIAGKDVANPLASILSAAMMLRMSFDMHTAAERIERAVRRVLASGYRTADIAEAGTKQVGTAQMGDLVVAALS
jgi:3-isopropylmalate dehydrogenase